MKRTWGLLIVAICLHTAHAQEKLLKLQVETRMDYQREYVDGESVDAHSGFKGKYLNVVIDGKINDVFSYSYRQRLNKEHSDQSFFDATDWIYLNYQIDRHWKLSAGKQVVGIGGYEYDRSPIDLYFCSEYWNNIPCYQLGASATYTFNKGKDQLMAQFCESPFRAWGDDMYAYNLMWYGSHGWLNTIYSVNLIECLPGKYISYLALGHKLSFGKVTAEVDFMNRAASHQTFLFRDCSVMGEIALEASERFRIFGKATYDVNRTAGTADYCVTPGTELTSIGAGVEFFPIQGKRDIRLHLFCAHAFGKNGNAEGAIQPKQTIADIGLKWKFDLLSIRNFLK